MQQSYKALYSKGKTIKFCCAEKQQNIRLYSISVTQKQAQYILNKIFSACQTKKGLSDQFTAPKIYAKSYILYHQKKQRNIIRCTLYLIKKHKRNFPGIRLL